MDHEPKQLKYKLWLSEGRGQGTGNCESRACGKRKRKYISFPKDRNQMLLASLSLGVLYQLSWFRVVATMPITNIVEYIKMSAG